MTIKNGNKRRIKSSIKAFRRSNVDFAILNKGVQLQLFSEGAHLYNYYPTTGNLVSTHQCSEGDWKELLPSNTVKALLSIGVR